MDVVHLRLFEVGRHPDVGDLGDHQQLLAGVDAFADFGGAFENDARGRGDDFRIAELQLGLLQHGLRGLLVGLLRLDVGLPDGELRGRVGLVLRQAGFHLRKLGLPLLDGAAAASTAARLASTVASWAFAVAAT
jgi:hypothetical protein